MDRRTSGLRGALLAAAAMGIVALALLVMQRPRGGSEDALLEASRSPLSALTAEREERAVGFSDGSRMVLAPHTQVSVRQNSRTAITWDQERGRATYSVAKGTGRRWVIVAGSVSVEVVGTEFDVDRREGSVHVSVTSGTVVVQSLELPEGAVTLTAGQRLEVRAQSRSAAGPGASSRPAPAASHAGETPSVRSTTPAPVGSVRGDWRALAAKGQNAQAYAELGKGGIAAATRTASVDELFALADVARLSGHPAEAVLPLEQILAAHAGDGRAPLAALTLGRIQLRSLGNPAAAVTALTRAMAMGIPGGVAEDAYAMLIEAYARSGSRPQAARTFEEYKKRFPGSPREESLRKWADGP